LLINLSDIGINSKYAITLQTDAPLNSNIIQLSWHRNESVRLVIYYNYPIYVNNNNIYSGSDYKTETRETVTLRKVKFQYYGQRQSTRSGMDDT